MKMIWLSLILALCAAAPAPDALAFMAGGTPTSSDPARCTEAPLTVADLDALPQPPAATPQGVLVPTVLPSGAPAPAAIEEAITERVDEFFACVATGDALRIYAFMSQRILAGASEESLASLETPPPTFTVEPQTGLYAGPWNVEVLPDGRVAAAIWMATGDEHPAPGKTAIWIFVREEDRWQLDEIITVVIPPGAKLPIAVADLVGTPPIGTPIPAP